MSVKHVVVEVVGHLGDYFVLVGFLLRKTNDLQQGSLIIDLSYTHIMQFCHNLTYYIVKLYVLNI